MLPEHWSGIVRNKYNVTDGLVFIKAVQGFADGSARSHNCVIRTIVLTGVSSKAIILRGDVFVHVTADSILESSSERLA